MTRENAAAVEGRARLIHVHTRAHVYVHNTHTNTEVTLGPESPGNVKKKKKRQHGNNTTWKHGLVSCKCQMCINQMLINGAMQQGEKLSSGCTGSVIRTQLALFFFKSNSVEISFIITSTTSPGKQKKKKFYF